MFGLPRSRCFPWATTCPMPPPWQPPNGAGKSTFLKAILGQREYEGVIAFSEPGQRSKKPRIGYVPQSPAFDPSDPVSVADLFACCMSKRPAFLGLGKAMRQKVLECRRRADKGQAYAHR